MWPRIANVIIGIWLMAAPAILNYGGAAATNDRIVGPIAAALATVAIWEPTRPLRWTNVLLGLWLILAPWVLGYDAYHPLPVFFNSTIAGAFLIAFGFVPGEIKERFGGGWSSLWGDSQ